jgi:hypothetical protein
MTHGLTCVTNDQLGYGEGQTTLNQECDRAIGDSRGREVVAIRHLTAHAAEQHAAVSPNFARVVRGITHHDRLLFVVVELGIQRSKSGPELGSNEAKVSGHDGS